MVTRTNTQTQDGLKQPQTNTQWKSKPSKKTRDKKPKRLQEANKPLALPIAKIDNTVKYDKCGLTFKEKGIKRHQTVKHKTAPTSNKQPIL